MLLWLVLLLNLVEIVSPLYQKHTGEMKWLILNKRNKRFHSSRVKFPLGRMSASWFLVLIDVFDLDFGAQINSIEQPIKSNSVGPGNMSHCGTPPIHNHFNYSFIVFKHIQQSFLMRRLDVWGNIINIVQNVDLPSRFLSSFSVNRSFSSFCWIVRNWCLFLAHPTYWNKCMTSENAQCSSKSGFRIFKISREVRVLKQSQSALFGSITHMTMLFVFTSVMKIWNQSIQTFVTGFGPFCDRSRKLINWP